MGCSVQQSCTLAQPMNAHLELAAIRAGEETLDPLRNRQRRQRHVAYGGTHERHPVPIAAEHELLEVRLNRPHRVHRWIEKRAEAEQEEQRPLEQYPVLRNLECRRQVAEGDVELPQV